MPKVAFRCDGAALPEIGTGHVIRSFALANALVQRKICKPDDICFISKANNEFSVGAKLIEKTPYQKKSIIDSMDLKLESIAETKAIVAFNPELVVFDRLKTNQQTLKNFRNLNFKTLSLDDDDENAPYVDLVINGIVHSKNKRDNILNGYQYLILPKDTPEFRQRGEKIKRLFVSFGGYDHKKLSKIFLQAVANIRYGIEVDLVIGHLSDFEFIELNLLIDKVKYFKVKLHQRPENFYSLMNSADASVVSGGITLFQSISCGLPTIAIPQYDHQLKTILNIEKSRAVIAINTLADDLELLIKKNLKTLIIDDRKRRDLSRKGKNTINRSGTNLVVKQITELLNNKVRS